MLPILEAFLFLYKPVIVYIVEVGAIGNVPVVRFFYQPFFESRQYISVKGNERVLELRKIEADRIIEEYVKPLYGFAMNKTRNINEAEELASRIILQVYDVLLKKESFIDLNTYVFKVAHNVWVRYVDYKTKVVNNLPIDEMNISSGLEIDKDILQSEMAGKLRLEITFLSNQQREIVILHYFKGLKVREIAERLNLSEGTVKWHLFESKKEMKKGMDVMRTVGSLGINPIKFTKMGHSGTPGKRGENSDFFRKTITQNIGYAAYHEPLTINKIAEELGVSPVFVEDEVKELEEYGFMDKLPGGRYQTNMLIIEESEEKWEELHSVYKKYADAFVEEYFLQLFNRSEQFKSLDIYYPNNDFNLLLWIIIPYAMRKLSSVKINKISFEEVSTLRKDGGNYLAFAYIQKEIKKSDTFDYSNCTEMIRENEEHSIYGWQFNTAWSNRVDDWRDNLFSDYIELYHFIYGELIEKDVNIDVYRRLIDKGYLIRTENGYKVNIVYSKNKDTVNKFNEMLPAPSEKVIKLSAELEKASFNIEKVGQPLHMHKVIRYLCQNKLTTLTTYVLKNLIDRGLLKEPTSEEAKGLSTILLIER